MVTSIENDTITRWRFLDVAVTKCGNCPKKANFFTLFANQRNFPVDISFRVFGIKTEKVLSSSAREWEFCRLLLKSGYLTMQVIFRIKDQILVSERTEILPPKKQKKKATVVLADQRKGVQRYCGRRWLNAVSKGRVPNTHGAYCLSRDFFWYWEITCVVDCLMIRERDTSP